MSDYTELVKNLRSLALLLDGEAYEDVRKAAAAIEELEADVPKWIRFESRQMDEEERQEYSERFGYELDDDEAVIYCCPLPDHAQEVLICDMYGDVRVDTFDNDPDYGIWFEENGDMDGIVAWMPLPGPLKEEQT